MQPPTSCLVYTPAGLSDALVKAVAPKRRCPELRWLEPCAGAGALLAAMHRHGVKRDQISAIDLARRAEVCDSLAKMRRGVDFLAWAQKTTLRFDRVVANPPYVAIRELGGRLLSTALSTPLPIGGGTVPHRANCWYAFLCASISLLRPNGSLAFVLPAAWEYADYAEPLRSGIEELFSEVVTYRSVQRLFSGVQEGAVVLVAKSFGGPSRGLRTLLYRRAANLIRAVGEQRTQPPSARTTTTAQPRRETVTFADVATIRIGAVTGDGRYFLLTEQERQKLALPRAALMPVLSKAQHLGSAEIGRRKWETLLKSGARVWLFRPGGRVLKKRSVRAYMTLGVEDGGCRRSGLHIRKRERWYKTVLPKAPDGFVSGMSRFGPWIAFRRDQRLTATNTLYAIRFKERLTRAEAAAWALMLLTSDVRSQVKEVSRVYPDGLLKIEPGELGRLRLPRPGSSTDALATYRKAVRALLAGNESEASEIADAFAAGRRSRC